MVEQAQRLSSVLAAVEAGAVAEADLRGLAKDKLHYGSTGDWLTHTGGLRRGEGKRRVVRAHALTGPLTRTRQALVAGEVSATQVDPIIDAVHGLPSGELVRARGEQAMLEHAKSLDATELARLGRHLAHVVDPDQVDRRLEAQLEREDRAAHLNRYLAITEDRAGGVRIKGYGSTEDAALLKAALLPLTCPTPTTDDEDGSGELARDPRDHGARMWDALIATAHHALTTSLPPETHATPPRLLVTLDHDTLKGELGARGIGTTEDGAELSPATLRRLACDAEIIPAVLGTRGEVLDIGRTRRLVTAVLWTALVLQGPALHLPRLHPTPGDVPRPPPPHWADGGTNGARQPRPALRAPPPGHPSARPGRSGSTPTTSDPNSGHHPNPVSTRMDPTKTPARIARRSEDPARPELHRDPRSGVSHLRYGVLPGALTRTAHHQQVAVTQLEDERLATPTWPEHQTPRVAERRDRDHGVLHAAAPDRVAVPRDAVTAVAVVAAAGRHERLAELGEVVGAQLFARLHEQRVRERLAVAVGVDEPRYVDDPVIHLPPLGPPRHVGHEPGEHLIGARHPVAAYVDPGAAGQGVSDRAGQRPEPGGGRLEEGALEIHACQRSTGSNRCSISP